MELKDYQVKTLDQERIYLQKLRESFDKYLKAKEIGIEEDFDFAGGTWKKMELAKEYQPKLDGLGQPLPNFCLKIPTGGGKTLLAVKTIDLINQIYSKKQTGLVLWIVPTTQIYRQTKDALKDLGHPYRQHLDLASGGKTLILEKSDQFSPQDLEENLVVLMLMLPAANRQTKEALKVFRDSGAFTEFFPPEDDAEGQKKLKEKISNLDIFGNEDGFLGFQIKTSLGNVLKLTQPIIILDEGQKAYSELAQKTLRDFNPLIIVELSATPPDGANVLVEILGTELNKEQMIKLDLHVTNKADVGWKETLTEAIHKRKILEKKAEELEANGGEYIRPICVIQAERTGKDQRGGNFIHSEDIREFLIQTHGILSEQVAVKTSDKDELKEIDDVGGLLSRNCQVRFIITKQALQEGWDCPFAYILTILTNPSSKNALTQLVGRILRQPYARKTGVKELDESYVYCFQQRANDLLDRIKKGFEGEGLGDLYRHVSIDSGDESEKSFREYQVKDRLKNIVKDIILPVFVVQEKSGWREVDYLNDLISRIDWSEINLDYLLDLKLTKDKDVGFESVINLVDDRNQLIERKEFKEIREKGLDVDPVFVAKYLTDIVPNPWVGFDVGKTVLEKLEEIFGKEMVVRNFVYIVEEMRKHLVKERDRLAEKVFRKLVNDKTIRFLVIGKDLGFKFPEKIRIREDEPLLQKNFNYVQKTLFDRVPVGDMNDSEKMVAFYLEDQDKLLFWYRNIAKQDYSIQGWHQQKIYPDFIFSTSKDQKSIEKVFVVEFKGSHLAGSEDSEYKKSLLGMCTKLAEEHNFSELGLKFKGKKMIFEFVEDTVWKQKLSEMIEN